MFQDHSNTCRVISRLINWPIKREINFSVYSPCAWCRLSVSTLTNNLYQPWKNNCSWKTWCLYLVSHSTSCSTINHSGPPTVSLKIYLYMSCHAQQRRNPVDPSRVTIYQTNSAVTVSANTFITFQRHLPATCPPVFFFFFYKSLCVSPVGISIYCVLSTVVQRETMSVFFALLTLKLFPKTNFLTDITAEK